MQARIERGSREKLTTALWMWALLFMASGCTSTVHSNSTSANIGPVAYSATVCKGSTELPRSTALLVHLLTSSHYCHCQSAIANILPDPHPPIFSLPFTEWDTIQGVELKRRSTGNPSLPALLTVRDAEHLQPYSSY